VNRRRFFLSALGASAAIRTGRPAGNRITQIAVAPIEGRFHKFVTINAYDKVPKSHTYPNHLLRIATSDGTEGIGVMGYGLPNDDFYRALKTLVGADPMSLYRMEAGRITGRSPAYSTVLRTYPFLGRRTL